jgi:hypothetical protein
VKNAARPKRTEDATVEAALARTILLLRDHVTDAAEDDVIADALTSVHVVIASDAENARFADAQHALVTAALLVARSGARVCLQIPDGVPLLGAQAPLRGDYLAPALANALADVVDPPAAVDQNPGRQRHDLAVVVGDTPWRGDAARVLRLQADAWSGAFASSGAGTRWRQTGSPFGPLASGGLVGAEAFKVAASRLRRFARDPVEFNALFAPTPAAVVHLAPVGTPAPRRRLGQFDAISAGAIIQAALFALGRIEGVEGEGRLVEPESSEVTNLNRYALLLRSRLGIAKADDVRYWADTGGLGGLRFEPVIARYDTTLAESLAPTAPAMLVGVDDIPSRWVAQAQWPAWLGIGATSHYLSVASCHSTGTGCARCLHPEDDPDRRPIPTVAFVSHWAGLWLAALFARSRGEIALPPREQSVFMSSLRAESAAAVWLAPVARRSGCPTCRAAA